MTFWYVLSGYLEFFYICAGVVCCVIVTLISGDLIFGSGANIPRSVRVFARLILYIPRLVLAILHANLDVAYRVLHPKMPIDPGIIIVDTSFTNDVLRTSFANAVTLTPGTVTIDVNGGTFIVHALVRESGESDLLKERSIEHELARVFDAGDRPLSRDSGGL